MERPNHSLSKHWEVWERELTASSDPDLDFILTGIKQGFRLTDPGSVFEPVCTQNYMSTSSVENGPLVQAQIQVEVDNGRYIKTAIKPTIVSALGAIPKDSGAIRLIHDCSRPESRSLNSYASADKVCFQSVAEAVKHIHHD